MSKKSTNVPKNMAPVYDAVVALTDKVCAERLNAEYAELARFATAALCRKRPSPLASGRPESWACGVLYALGFVNFLFDKENTPHLSADALCAAFGVSKSNGAAKSKQVRDALDLTQFHPDWCLPSKLDDNPMAWLIQVNGLVVDVRSMPREVQEIAHRKGLIPYIPADREKDHGEHAETAAAPAAKPAKSANPAKTGTVHQLKITLRGGRPAIWRRIQVASNTRLDALHRILQVVIGWENYHLHQFVTGKRPTMQFYAPPEIDDGYMDVADETKYTVAQIAPQEKAKFIYEYDFGDGWKHEIVVEKILPRAPDGEYPICLAGKRACPPEDVGGIWGYAEFLEIIGDPKHPEHEERLEWVGGEFDPAYFEVDKVNKMLRSAR